LISVKNAESGGAVVEIKLPLSHKEQTVLPRRKHLPV
jgi:hypothetical protein